MTMTRYLTIPNTHLIILTESEHMGFFMDRMNLGTDNAITSDSLSSVENKQHTNKLKGMAIKIELLSKALPYSGRYKPTKQSLHDSSIF